MNFKELETRQKLRGGYYTPLPIAELLSKWVLVNGATTILEPSCGDGVFLQALYTQTATATPLPQISIEAVEIVAEEVAKTELRSAKLRNAGVNVQVIQHDIFSWLGDGNSEREWDAIIGNPPYIRYQYFGKEQQDLAEQLFKRANVPFSRRTNAWVPLVIASVIHLKPGGCLAMVLPAELLHIHHASGLRQLLEQEMETITLIDIREMVFPAVLQGVMLLLAIKKRGRAFQPLVSGNGSPHTTLAQSTAIVGMPDKPASLHILDLDNLASVSALQAEKLARNCHQRINATGGEWMLGLLRDEEMALMREIKAHKAVLPFMTIASVDIGIVTGANNFFVVNRDVLKQFELESIATPMLAKSDLIKGITYTQQDHWMNEEAGKAVHFLKFPATALASLPVPMANYIRSGEAQKLQERYKCRIREPWYVVPYTWTAEMALLKRCHHFPRLVINELRAHSTDTAYRVRLQPDYAGRARDMAFSFLNSLTFLCAELGGRHYGGGVLELVPSEIEKLLIPLQKVEEHIFAQTDALIRNNASLEELLDFTDPLILGQGLDLTARQIRIIQETHRRLLKRRLRT